MAERGTCGGMVEEGSEIVVEGEHDDVNGRECDRMAEGRSEGNEVGECCGVVEGRRDGVVEGGLEDVAKGEHSGVIEGDVEPDCLGVVKRGCVVVRVLKIFSAAAFFVST